MNRARIPGLSQLTAAAVTAAMAFCVTTALAQQAPGTRPAAPPAPARPAPTTAGAAPSTPGKSGGSDEVIARVGTTSVSADDVRTYVASLAPRDQAAVTKDPALLSQAVRLMLTNRLVLQEAQGKKYEQQPAVVAQLEQIKENAVIELYLQSVTVPPSNYPSEDEVQKAYEGAKSQLLVPRQFELSQIFMAVPKDADKATEDKARQHADEVARKVKAPGADFAAAAAAESKDSSDLGWLQETQIRQEIRTQVAGLAKNAVTDPVKLDDGWHILKLLDTKAAYTRTLPEVRDQLVQQMRAERSGMLRRAYLGELQRQHPPVLNELALSGIYDSGKK